MSKRAEIITAISTLGCAIGIGFFMQSGDVAEARYGSGELAQLNTTALVGTPATRRTIAELFPPRSTEPLDVRSITLTSASRQTILIDEPADILIKTAVEVSSDDIPETGKSEHLAQADKLCPIQAVAEQNAAAMIAYTLEAPCFADTRVILSHNGLTFSDLLSAEGKLELLVPALAEEAWITAAFHTGETVDAVAWIDSVPLYDRVVVQWRGEAGIQVHAREDGADYGEAGHVWSGAARDVSAVAKGEGGFLTVLGDPDLPNPMQAEIYTFPSAFTESAKDVKLSVEAEVTDRNCGKEIRARAFQYDAGRNVSTQDLTLSVPGCDAVGSFLVLNNLLQDLTVASK